MTSDRVQQALAAYDRDAAAHLEDLKALVRIPGIPFPGFPSEPLGTAADATAALLRAAGFPDVRLLGVDGAPPYVYAHLPGPAGAPTVLLYAHYDVQPPGGLDEWTVAPPFEPTERDGRLYGRGTCDDKAGIVVHAAAVAAWQKAGGAPVGVKVVIEGEEEVGSDHLGAFLARYRELLAADALVIMDTGNVDAGLPALTVALRGLVVATVEVRALQSSVHSGSWGGPVPDPAMALCKILAALQADDGTLTIPGIYDDVQPLSPEARRSLAQLPLSPTEFRKQAGMLPGVELLGGRNPFEMNWWQPSLAVNAMVASSKAEARNIINDKAWARLGIRLVPAMDADKVGKALVEAVKRAAPWGVQVDVKLEMAGGPWQTAVNHPAFAGALRALAAGYGREPLTIGCGGSIGFVDPFVKALGGAPALLMGVEDPYSNAHGPNESLLVEDFHKSVRSEIRLFAELAGVGR